MGCLGAQAPCCLNQPLAWVLGYLWPPCCLPVYSYVLALSRTMALPRSVLWSRSMVLGGSFWAPANLAGASAAACA